jgi:hypothetical protein
MREQRLQTIRQACITANEDILSRRPEVVRLADILMAVGQSHPGKVFLISSAGVFASFKAESGLNVYQGVGWNLRKDELTDQSDACIDFLYHLLKVE